MNFFRGLFSVAFIYAIGWAIFQWGYSSGADSERCARRHSYHYDKATPAFARISE